MFSISECLKDEFPDISSPNMIGYFSIDKEENLSPDASQLRYYVDPSESNNNCTYNLDGYTRSAEREKSRCCEYKLLHHALIWIKLNIEHLRADPITEKWIQSDFVIGCGLLPKLLQSPYEMRQRWTIRAVKWKGTIYLCEISRKKDKIDEPKVATDNEFQLKCESWKHEFEQCLTTDDPDQPSDVSEPLVKKGEFRCMIQRSLNDKQLLFIANVGVVDSKSKLTEPLNLNDNKFVLLKMCGLFKSKHNRPALKRFKFIKWWTQCYMNGIEKVVCGFRDNEGVVKSIETFSLSYMETSGKKHWSGAKCVKFLDQFLQFVQETIVKDYNEAIYQFEKIPEEDGLVVKVIKPDAVSTFLPPWYTI